ncbi:energy transducer TonB [Pseudoalteromonas umbrosa]|uniref:energy transducer TonB n=1 Tax=Pseudoalteromonas umbrosa TaxID=3048489 RepID=UPI0024C3D5FB|nr:energy transducer TonB [Pseudoalteromonas sp. B95]MDK1288442.1 energy transducer TonB [Pseudoalteromonas sp. B95]
MKSLSLGIVVLFLFGCSSSSNLEQGEKNNIIDLTKSNTPTEQYWKNTEFVHPIYPIRAAENGVGGCVEFELVISSKGRVSELQIIKSVPSEVFDLSAKKALRKFKWKPADDNQFSHPVRTTLQLDFSMTPIQTVPECTSA